ncbi:MAG: hypothetical protein NUV86_08565 [Candidatus Scalindua sp.]|nr:hypothetical protein [Candidatus Scalindua sp.]
MVIITGCTETTVKSQLNILAFQEENLPIRTLRLGVFLDSTYSGEEIAHLVDEASTALEEQLGIHLEIVYNRPINLEERECDLMLDELQDSALRVPDSVDVAVAFVSFKIPGSLFMWKGVIDDSYRRYIILRGSTKELVHEIGHCFILSHSHSSNGVMKSAPSTIYFSPADREEILKNKWRNFNEKPDLDERDEINLLKEDRN